MCWLAASYQFVPAETLGLLYFLLYIRKINQSVLLGSLAGPLTGKRLLFAVAALSGA